MLSKYQYYGQGFRYDTYCYLFFDLAKKFRKEKKIKKIQKDTNEESPEDCPSWW